MRGFLDFLRKTNFHCNAVGLKFNLFVFHDDAVHLFEIFGQGSFHCF